jgi:hypothetical protein
MAMSLDNYVKSKEEFIHEHSGKVEATQPGAGGVFTDLPKTTQLMKRTVREYKVPRWI